MDRNKWIAPGAVGIAALLALWIAFPGLLSGDPASTGPGPATPRAGEEVAGAADGDAITDPDEPVAGLDPDDGAAAPQPDTGARTVAGSDADTGSVVVRAVWSDGEPAAGVMLTVVKGQRGLPREVLAREATDEDGVLVVARLRPGPINVRSERGGSAKAEIVAGERVECAFELPEGVAIDGTVTDAGGAPVAGAHAWLQTHRADWTGGTTVARSAEDGTFALRHVPPGMSLGAFAAGHARSGLIDLDSVDTSAPPVALTLVLGEGGAGSVAGRVLDSAGAAVSGAIIALGKRPRHIEWRGNNSWAEKWTHRVATTDRTGRFAFAGVASGTLPLAVRADGFGIWRGDVTVEDDTCAEVEITMLAAVSISGTVTDGAGEPRVGATVRVYDLEPRVPFIQGGQIDFDETFGALGAVTDDAGRYRVDGATPGAIHLFAQPKHRYTFGHTVPFARTMLEAEPGDQLEWHAVVDPGQTIEGVVLFADGVAMGNVFITAKDEAGGPEHIMHCGQDGRFRFVCLEGDSYSLHVQLWSPPEGTPPLEVAGITVGSHNVELRATYSKEPKGASGSVSGLIDDVESRISTLKKVRVQLISEKRWWRTDHDVGTGGTFEFTGVEPGRYRIAVMSGEISIAHKDWFELEPGAALDVGAVPTAVAGALVIHVERGEHARELEPKLYLRFDGWSRGAEIEIGRRNEVRVPKLTAGEYQVSGHASGMVSIRDEVTIRPGETAELRLSVRGSVRVPIDVWFPEQRAFGVSTIRIVDASGGVLTESRREHGEAPPRRIERNFGVAPGTWTVEVTTDSGLSGQATFHVASATGEPDVVRVDVK